MKALVQQLRTFVPGLTTKPEEIADLLTNLGFEAVVENKEVLDVSFTPNRGDAMSALGLARELRAWLNRESKTVDVLALTDTKLIDALAAAENPKIELTAKELVSRYDAVVFDHVTVGPSPKWLQEAVANLGWRSINNVVDLTNYLMDIYGQPLHAFDLDAILGQTMTVRSSIAGEHLTTLDGVDRVLPGGLLVIQDRDDLIDLAGIMGGANSEIHPKTTRVLLQAAAFDPAVIRQATRALGHRTAAAIRYERGTDPLITRPVLNEAIRLLTKKEFGSAKPIGQISLHGSSHPQPAIQLDPNAVNALLGFLTPIATQRQLLEQLGCTVESVKASLNVTPPSWRYDLTIWQDFAEEIARLSNLNDGIPAKSLSKQKPSSQQSTLEWAEGLKDRLVELGLSEVLTYSFTSKELLDVLELPVVGELANPLNPTLRYLRPSLVPNLAHVAATNALFDPLLVFEIGHTFTKTSEEDRLAIGLVGSTQPTAAWLARLADAIGLDSGELAEKAMVTELTQVQREVLKIRKARASFIEFRLADIRGARRIPATASIPEPISAYRPVSRYPAVNRDVALLVPVAVSPDSIRTFVCSFDQWVEAVTLFDEFQSDKLGKDVKSLAYHIRYADLDRTLREDEVTALHERLIAGIERTFDAKVR